MNKYLKAGVLTTGIFFLFLLFSVTSAYSQTYTTIADGNWNSASTWAGGSIPPTAGTIPATAVINIHHVVNYNTGNPIKNNGTITITPLGLTTATLNVPTNINVENFAPLPRGFYIIRGSFLQCRFVGCNDGQPYSGTNPGAPIQSGTFKNIGGYVELRNANVEVAQDWTSEANGTRLMIESCVTTGQNFSISGSGSSETIVRSSISIGWHNSGNFQLADATANFDAMRVQLAGSSGSFQLNSGTANGDIDYITLRNHIVPFTGSGEIFASSSLTTTGINLDAYCVSTPSKYVPNGKFTGTQTSNCGLVLFPANCSVSIITAADASIQGRVLTAEGRGISNVIVELSGGDLPQPITARTGSFGYFNFKAIPVGQTYVLTVHSKRYVFSNPTRVLTVQDDVSDVDFIADGEGVILKRSLRK